MTVNHGVPGSSPGWGARSCHQTGPFSFLPNQSKASSTTHSCTTFPAVPRILHITSWYPHPEDPLEGKFIADRISGLNQWFENVVEHIRISRSGIVWSHRTTSSHNLHQHFIRTRILPWKWLEWYASKMVLSAWKKHRERGVDAIVIHVAYPFAVHLARIREELPVPILISEHWSAYHYNLFMSEGHRSLSRIRGVFQAADGIIAVSHTLAKDIRQFSRDPSLAIEVAGNPIDGSLFCPRTEFPRKGFFAVNRWSSVKNPLLLLEAWKMVQQERPGLDLCIAGDGPHYAAMSQWITTEKLDSVIQMVGPMTTPEVAAAMQRVVGFVTPSSYETFSISCAEALMCGTPVACTPLASVREYARDHEVYFSSDHTPEGLCEAILALLDDPERSAQQTIADHAHNLFDQKNNNARFASIISQYLNRPE